MIDSIKPAKVLTVAILSLGIYGVGTAKEVLTLDEAIKKTLEQNFTIQVEKVNPKIAKQDLRAARGLFDPVLEVNYNYSNRELMTFEEEEESVILDAGIRGTLPWGTEIFAGIEGSDFSSPFSQMSGSSIDEVSAFSGVSITQPLLRDFGLAGSRYTQVRIARRNLAASEYSLKESVMIVVQSVIEAYHTVYFAKKNLEIAIQNRDLAAQLLKDNEKRVETGVMAPLDRVQAESEAALREVSVISARSFLRQANNNLKNLIYSDPKGILETELAITDLPEPKFSTPNYYADLEIALEERPDYRRAITRQEISRLELANARRSQLPQLDLVASYGQSARGSSFNNALDRSFDDGEAVYTIGAVVRIPFPNRERSARKLAAKLRYNQQELQVSQSEQDIRIELDDAITQLEADWQRIQAARKARELAELSLEAEEKKLQAGTSSTFIVLRLQGDLASAEVREANALTDYFISLAQYQRSKGVILNTYNIVLQ